MRIIWKLSAYRNPDSFGAQQTGKANLGLTAYGIFSLGYLEAFNLLAATWKAAQKENSSQPLTQAVWEKEEENKK